MNTKIPLKEAIRKLSIKLALLLLIFQINSCELEVIPPTTINAGKTRSSFQFQVPPTPCASDCNVTFTNTSQNADTYEWNFGDESPVSTLANPTHTYADPGSYDVTLTAFRNTIEKDTTMTVLINAPPSILQAFFHTATAANISTQVTWLQNVLTDGLPTKIVVVTPVLGLRNTSALGVYYYSNKWSIFTEDVRAIQENETFNVVVSDPGPNAFVHQTSAANLRTGHISTIDNPATNNHPNARVFVSPIWEVYPTDYNTHPIGVVYINNHWEIMNLDQAALPLGLKFNVIVSSNDTESFTHTTTAASISGGDYTTFDHVKTNTKQNIKIITMLNQGTNDALLVNPRVTGIWYRLTQGKWTIFNQEGTAMPTGVTYNILAID